MFSLHNAFVAILKHSHCMLIKRKEEFFSLMADPLFPIMHNSSCRLDISHVALFSGKRAFIAGIADDNGYGWAIAKSLAAAGAEILVGTWVPVCI